MSNYSSSIIKIANEAIYKSYLWMSFGLAITAIVSFLISNSPDILNFIFEGFNNENKLFNYNDFYINLEKIYENNNNFILKLNSINENDEKKYENIFKFLKININDNSKKIIDKKNIDKFFKNLNLNIISKILINQREEIKEAFAGTEMVEANA